MELLVRDGGKIAPSLVIVITFCNILYVIVTNLYTVALFTLIEPSAPSLVTKVILALISRSS